MKKYLYKAAATGEWVFGVTTTSYCPAGMHRLETKGTTDVTIININTGESVGILSSYDQYRDEAGVTYVSLAAFTAATKDFFTEAGASDVLVGSIELVTQGMIDGSQVTQLVDPNGLVLYPTGKPHTEEVEISRPANVTAYAALDTIARLAANVAQVTKITLSGTPPEKQIDTVTLTGTSGTAIISETGGLAKTATFAADLTNTAANFVTAFAADYLAEGIVVTSAVADLIFTALNYGVAFDSPVVTPVIPDLDGTVVNTQANVVIGEAEVTVTGGVTALISFDVSGAVNLEDTASMFAGAYIAAYAAEGIDLTSSGSDIIFTAAVAGIPFDEPVVTNTAGDLEGVVETTVANDIIDSIELENMAIANGGGGVIEEIKIESNMVLIAGTKVRVWFFNEAPATVPLDNYAFVLSYADRGKRLFYVDVTMETKVGASDTIFGQATIEKNYKCADTSLFVLVETVEGFTPTSGGDISIMLNALIYN